MVIAVVFVVFVVQLTLDIQDANGQYVPFGGVTVPSGTVGQSWAGFSVATSEDGTVVVVGAPADNQTVGAIWVYALNELGNQYVQIGDRLVGDDGGNPLKQGFSVDISADGKTIVTGGFNEVSRLGGVWVYAYNEVSGLWEQQGTRLNVPTNAGFAVSITPDGTKIVIGAPYSSFYYGTIWVYELNAVSGKWEQYGQNLVPTNELGNVSFFGYSVGISADGSTIVGAGPYDNSSVGAIWIFTLNGQGVYEQEGGKLTPIDYQGEPKFGSSVAISGNGTTIAVGGVSDNLGTGAVWIYTFNASLGVWGQMGTKLFGFDSTPPSYQGNSVSLSADGVILAYGGPGDFVNLGATWVFTLNASQSWSQYGSKLVGGYTVGQQGLQGSSVSLSADSTTLIVGGPKLTGAVWEYQLNKTLLYAPSAIIYQGSSVYPVSNGILAPGYSTIVKILITDTFTDKTLTITNLQSLAIDGSQFCNGNCGSVLSSHGITLTYVSGIAQLSFTLPDKLPSNPFTSTDSLNMFCTLSFLTPQTAEVKTTTLSINYNIQYIASSSPATATTSIFTIIITIISSLAIIIVFA